MLEALQLDSGESTGVRQASMAKCIHYDAIRRPKERPDHSEIGGIA